MSRETLSVNTQQKIGPYIPYFGLEVWVDLVGLHFVVLIWRVCLIFWVLDFRKFLPWPTYQPQVQLKLIDFDLGDFGVEWEILLQDAWEEDCLSLAALLDLTDSQQLYMPNSTSSTIE